MPLPDTKRASVKKVKMKSSKANSEDGSGSRSDSGSRRPSSVKRTSTNSTSSSDLSIPKTLKKTKPNNASPDAILKKGTSLDTAKKTNESQASDNLNLQPVRKTFDPTYSLDYPTEVNKLKPQESIISHSSIPLKSSHNNNNSSNHNIRLSKSPNNMRPNQNQRNRPSQALKQGSDFSLMTKSATSTPRHTLNKKSQQNQHLKSLSVLHFHESNNLNETDQTKAARELYEKVAAEVYSSGGYKDIKVDDGTGKTKTLDKQLPNRSPYKCGSKLGRGAHFMNHFTHFIQSGGIAKWKNAVMMNIRVNDIRDIQSGNGSGSFKVNFFLDTAFWVPEWDYDHYATQNTVGTFTKYEPEIQFPEVDGDSGMLRWGVRTAEFSKDVGKSRHHEIQIGQNFETFNESRGGIELFTLMRGSIGSTSTLSPNGQQEQELHELQHQQYKNNIMKKTITVTDEKSHWPRLWRIMVSNDELTYISYLESSAQKLFEPTNSNPTKCHERLKELFTKLDNERMKNLSNLASEGIGFVSYEISCTHRNEFALHEFPFDMHNLKIIVRIEKKDKDPMQRIIIPMANDKGFYISSRVADLVDYHLAKNLDWAVTKEPVSLGGNQRLTASAIVRRKPGYYIRNYLIIIFLLSSSSFTCFIVRPDDYETRSMIIFTLLLSVVAFKYSGDDLLPCVSYPTILDTFILYNFYVVICVGFVSFGFAAVCGASGVRSENYHRKMQKDILCSRQPGRWYGVDSFPAYGPVFETLWGIFIFMIWILTNTYYWLQVYNRIQFNIDIMNKVDIKWMKHKNNNKSSTSKSHYRSDKLVTTSRRPH